MNGYVLENKEGNLWCCARQAFVDDMGFTIYSSQEKETLAYHFDFLDGTRWIKL